MPRFFSNEWLSKTIIVKKYGVIFSPNPDSPAAYRGNAHLEKPRDSRSPGSGGASTHDAFSVCRGTTKNRQAGRVTTLHDHSKRFQENVLDGTKREYYDAWFQKNVLDGTKSWSQ